ncbi:MAG: hypothetical protein ACTHZK_10630 [Arthrobacter sp.]|uniref:hypothetical protein n=1 Tax=unclassified Arthrobacter TaxID=235627 RepID=UPI003FB83D3F
MRCVKVSRLFDEIEDWIHSELSEATEGIASGLDIRFDPEFRALVEEAPERGEFDELSSYFEQCQTMVDNMDYELRFAAI